MSDISNLSILNLYNSDNESNSSSDSESNSDSDNDTEKTNSLKKIGSNNPSYEYDTNEILQYLKLRN